MRYSKLFFFFLYCRPSPVCISYFGSTSVGPAAFAVLNSYRWLVATDRGGIGSGEKQEADAEDENTTIVGPVLSHQHRVGQGW